MTETPHFTPNSARRVEILAFPGVQLLDVAGPLQVFATANDLAHRCGAPAPYALAVVAARGPGVETSAGLSILAGPLPEPESEVDTFLVAGGFGVDAAAADAELVGWLGARSRRPRRLASVCSGALLLAAAGLFERPARDDALGVVRPIGAPLSRHPRRKRPDLRAGRPRVDLGRRHRRH